ncbi:MAG: phage major capsid protein [Planctomycetota bacterium]
MKTTNLQTMTTLALLAALGPVNITPNKPKAGDDSPSAVESLNEAVQEDRTVELIDAAMDELHDEGKRLLNITADKRTDVQDKRVDAIMVQMRELRNERGKREVFEADVERRARQISNAINRPAQPGESGASGDYAERRQAINHYYRTGELQNALSTASGSGVQVPEESTGKLFEKMKGFQPLLDLVEVHPTSTGGTIPIPILDDTANSGRQRASELEAANDLDPTITGLSLGAWPLAADRIKVSYPLLRDGSYPVESKVEEVLLRRLSRKLAGDMITADGSSKINGLISASGINVPTSAASNFNSFGDLIDLMGAVDSAYADVDVASYLISHKLFVTMLKLKESQNKYHEIFETRNGLWYFNDFRVRVAPQMAATLADNSVHALFGYFKAYQLRLVGNPRVRRSETALADDETIHFNAFWEADGDLADANAIANLSILAS